MGVPATNEYARLTPALNLTARGL